MRHVARMHWILEPMGAEAPVQMDRTVTRGRTVQT